MNEELDTYDDYPEAHEAPTYKELLVQIEEQGAHIYELEQMLSSIRGLGGLADEGADEAF
jgi:bacterioferritin (cytochrome b1)